MKKLLLLTTIAVIGLASCKKKGCMDPAAVNYNTEAKKDDGTCNYTPNIVMNGSATVTINVGDTYTDAGANASNHDGSFVAVNTDETQVNTAAVGNYFVVYTATNEHGTTEVARAVNVVIGQANFVGNWNTSNDCNVALFSINGSQSIAAGATENDLVISNMFALAGDNVNATIDGQTVTVPQQTVNVVTGDIIFNGSGSMNVDGTQIVINYDYENTTPFVGGTGSCTITYDL